MPAAYADPQVNAMNDNGLVVGVVQPINEESGEAQAFAWSPTTGTTLSGWGGSALDVNNSGQVLVTAQVLRGPVEQYPIEEYSYFPSHLLLWSPGGPARDIGSGEAGFGEGDSSRRINESGQVASTLEPNLQPHCAFLWDPRSNTRTYVGRDTQAHGINDNGQVLGRWVTTYSSFIWDPETGMTDLGTMWASDLNGQGQVVGSQEERAVVWDPATGMTDLGVLHSGEDSEAWAINDRGEIVGWSGRIDRTGEDDPGPDPVGHAVLWTPEPVPGTE
jgi:probable HAF family extracellular repeat protein